MSASLLASCLLCVPPGYGAETLGGTSVYAFQPDRSTIVQTGGIAGVHRTYTIQGTFRLTIDSSAGTASFDRVDANAVDDSPYRHALDPNQVFNMAELVGKVVDKSSIRFEGKADAGSSVLITLTFADSAVALKGETVPPPNSADFFMFTLDAVAQRKYAGGRGTADDPYQIATAADLILLGQSPEDYHEHFVLTADIDLDPKLPGRKVFDTAVIAPDTDPVYDFQGVPFTGVFDGDGHTISNLTAEGASYLGLFGQLGSVNGGAEVRDLGLVDVSIIGSGEYVGGLVGCNYRYSGIATSHCTGTVTGNRCVGGLVGYNLAGVTNSYANASVSGISCVGGLIGTNDVDLMMMGYEAGKVFRCYSAGVVTGNTSVGGLVGANSCKLYGAERSVEICCAEVADCFWDKQASTQNNSAGGTGKTTAEMQTAKTYLDAGWDFVGETANGTEDIWWILEGQDYPRLAWERVVFDDFEDGKAEPLWMVCEPEPDRVRIKEVNGRLEVEAVAQQENVDAIYASTGWRLDATKDFALRVDFHFSKQGAGDGRVTLGLVPSLDPSGMRWAELEAGCFDTGPFYLYEVRDGFWVEERVTDRSSDNGTLYMSYNPDTDELYFSYTGYGMPNAWKTVSGLLKGRWAGGPVYVILAGGSEGMALDPGDAWLDNFAINTGTVINSP